ncbi:hypothetical protein NXS19_003204 [Fusarium pseudograminearum]|nr:hypothetical protein NXS19_003204 [Fusarium pseudograminearum]
MGFTIRGLASAALLSFSLCLTSALVAQPQAPEPTLPPRIQQIEHIYERADGTITETLNVIVAANNTCGFLTPNTETHLTCFSDYKCLYETEKYNVAVCPKSGFHTACMNSEEAGNTSKCDDHCRTNTNIRKCSESGNTECLTIYYPNSMKQYFCHASSAYRNAAFMTGLDDLQESTLKVNFFPAVTTASSTEASDDATSTRPTTSTTTTDEPPEEEGGGGSKSNVGAIAGGVVGGVAGLAALGLAMFFLRRRSNKKKEQQTPVAMADQSSLQPQMPQGMTPEQYQRWSTTSHSPQAWKPTDSPSVAPNQSPQFLVEAPNDSAAQVHEMDGGGRSIGR